MNFTPAQLAAALDSTNLRLDATEADITTLCEDAAKHRFACVMLYPTSVEHAARVLAGSGIRIGTVVGFPSGRFSPEAKIAEVIAARTAGAHEVDVVMNYAALLDGDLEWVDGELRAVARAARAQGLLLKIIVETCYLDADHRISALRLCEDAGADFIKTSTGFGTAGAQVDHIAGWAAARRGPIRLKASGGIKNLAQARALLEAGATRLGTSNAVQILAELTSGGDDAATAPGGGY